MIEEKLREIISFRHTMIKAWMNAQFLTLNQEKTEIICFRPPKCDRHDTIFGTFYKNDCIRFSNAVKN